jgi:hypothetical protein
MDGWSNEKEVSIGKYENTNFWIRYDEKAVSL